MRGLVLVVLTALIGCKSGSDADGDGTVDAEDCSPNDAAVSPDADEVCNGVDDDCNGDVDDDPTDGASYHLDRDGDGFGGPGSVTACDAPEGSADNNDDCNDNDDTVYPGAPETCDGTDEDCDNRIDVGATDGDGNTYYVDSDGDGHGDPGTPTKLCAPTAGYVTSNDDCDDTDPAPSSYTDAVVYADTDGDGFGDPNVVKDGCDGDPGWVSNATDCDDTDGTLSPNTVWYRDNDLDGYGSTSSTIVACAPGNYWERSSDDCDDTNPATYPGAPEVCSIGLTPEGKDNDCDLQVDEECPTPHCGLIASDETWAQNAYGHVITCDVRVQGASAPKLVIGDGATVEFMAGTSLLVGVDGQGDIDVRGNSQGVVFTSAEAVPKPGDYAGLLIGPLSTARSSLSKLTVEYGGSNISTPGAVSLIGAVPTLSEVTVRESKRNGIFIRQSSPTITDTIVEDNQAAGVVCLAEPCLNRSTSSFARNEITGNGGEPIRVFPGDINALSSSSTFIGNIEDVVYILGGNVSDDAEWQHLDVPYRATGNITVGDGDSPILTIDGGVQIGFERALSLTVGAPSFGDLIVDGSDDPVVFTSAILPKNAGDWTGIVLGAGSSDFSIIEGAEIAYAGYGTAILGGGGLSVFGGKATIDDAYIHHSLYSGILARGGQLAVTNSRLTDNGTIGVLVEQTGNLWDVFSDNVVTDNGSFAASFPSSSLAFLDDSSEFTGNGKDFVQVSQGPAIDLSGTWPALDVPYYVRDNLLIESPLAPQITIADGVQMYFAAGTGLNVGASSYADLVIAGDRENGQGVLFASGTGAGPGSWAGLYLGQFSSVRTKLRGFTVDDGGARTAQTGGVTLAFANASMSDCEITDSLHYGVYATQSNFDMVDCTISGTQTTTPSTLPDGDGIYIGTTGSTSIGSFARNIITDNDRYPMNIPANQMVRLDEASTYAGNGVDWLYITADLATRAGTWGNLDVPWYISGPVTIGSATAPLIRSTNATYLFGPGQGLAVGGSANAYADFYCEGCVFTSGRPVKFAGDWKGISYSGIQTPLSGIVNSEISYAGALSTPAALTMSVGTAGTFTGNHVKYSYTSGIQFCGTAVVSDNTYTAISGVNEYGCL